MFSPPIGSPAAFASACRDEASLNVIIPMGGAFSEAFRTAGYSAPKPMIKIAGRPMLLHLLDQLGGLLGQIGRHRARHAPALSGHLCNRKEGSR